MGTLGLTFIVGTLVMVVLTSRCAGKLYRQLAENGIRISTADIKKHALFVRLNSDTTKLILQHGPCYFFWYNVSVLWLFGWVVLVLYKFA